MKTKTLIGYYVALFIGALLYWFVTLIPLNLRDQKFFIHFIVLVFLILLPFYGLGLRKMFREGAGSARSGQAGAVHTWSFRAENVKSFFSTKRLLLIPIALLALFIVLNLTGLPQFQAKNYASLIERVDGVFQDDIAEIQFYDIPTVDRVSAIRLGNKKMGEISNLVSQFNVSEDYIQINYRGRPVRVTPLEYGDIFKWFNNRSEGIPRYIRVDLISSDVDLDVIAGGMKYSQSEPLLRNIDRHVRFQFPFAILGDEMFEIDEAGVPYWITPVFSPRVGWFNGLDVKDVILTNAVDGKSTRLPIEECPSWVDRAYPSDMIIHQLNDNGRYQSGWLNSMFGQRGVLQTTEGYNYLAINDDVFLYTGITSVSGDSSNLGFVLVNQRTKEAKYYQVTSADEYSAMASAQGAVQEKGYQSTFPILLNIEGRPTYCMALKDKAELVKMYALVDAQNYQVTAVGDSIRAALANYKVRLAAQLTNDEELSKAPLELETIEGVITDISAVVIDGNTYFYFMLENHEQVFTAAHGAYERLPFLQAGDGVQVDYRETGGSLTIVDAMRSLD